MKNYQKLIPLLTIIIIFTFACKDDNTTINPSETTKGTFVDVRDNHHYKWIKIGGQIWMAENLAFKPNNGNHWAYDNSEQNIAIYGYLYDWHTAQTIAPDGWHLPSYSEWTILINSLGGYEVSGGKMKESGTAHWNSPNTGADNSSGFTALPNGLYSASSDYFLNINKYSFWWSSTENDTLTSKYIFLSSKKANISLGSIKKTNGYALRCIKNL